MSECVLDLSDIIYALNISALRSEWKHIPCYEKNVPKQISAGKTYKHFLSNNLGW